MLLTVAAGWGCSGSIRSSFSLALMSAILYHACCRRCCWCCCRRRLGLVPLLLLVLVLVLVLVLLLLLLLLLLLPPLLPLLETLSGSGQAVRSRKA